MGKDQDGVLYDILLQILTLTPDERDEWFGMWRS